jgi:glycosyltransferase involved in cell wall biosynthesis
MTLLATVSRTVRSVALAVATEPTTFSFVIPTYNERDDIGATLDAVLAQRHRPKDVIVVDGGSTDGTRELLRERSERDGITLIKERRRRGVAAARNAGIDVATGDVVVILNADVVPPPDFLQRLDDAYRRGAEMVSIQSRVMNTDSVTGRFMQATHDLEYGPDAVGWTEGFSCRRDLALKARFPEELPGAGGEDVEFFGRLRHAGARWNVDYSIVVGHRVPSTLSGFWRQWRGRGNAVPYIELRLRSRPLEAVIAMRALASMKSAAQILALYPMYRRARDRARLSSRGMDDLAAFWLLAHAQVLAHRAGEWQIIARLLREGKARS